MLLRYFPVNFSGFEREFMQNVLDDPRAWDVDFEESKNEEEADIIVYKTPGTVLNKMYPMDHLQNLSLTDRSRYPIVIHLREENWNEGRGGYTNVYAYRIYLILHEFGHAIGYGHVNCPGKGMPAPVMMQQTKGTGECYPEPWVKKF